MKIKVENHIDDIRLKVSHKELRVILNGLNRYLYEPKNHIDVEEINELLFDKDEFEDEVDIDCIIGYLFTKIENKLNKIPVW